jgi:hypothetical protein
MKPKTDPGGVAPCASLSDLPPIPDDGFISLHQVARLTGGGDPGVLENACLRLSLPMETAGPGWGRIRTTDLPALLGASQARNVLRMHRPEMTRFTSLGPVLGVVPGECLRLAQLRGVTVDHTQAIAEVSRSGAVHLRKILDVERGIPPEPTDWVKGELVLPQIQAVMRTHTTGGIEESAADERDGPRRDPDAMLVLRCRWLDVRHRKEPTSRYAFGRVQVLGFDLYRLLGIAAAGADTKAYLEKMQYAYRTVFPEVVETSQAG